MKLSLLVIVACVLVGITSAANNCPGAAGSAGVNCTDASLCCGSGTITPSCLPANGSKICCVHYLASTQCNPDQVCGGGGGPGASSYAQCGPPGSTFCDKGDGQGAFCTAAAPTCCGYYGGYGFCCAPGCACNNSAYTCSCPTTVAPTTVAPTTAAPTTTPAPPKNNCPGAGSYAGVNCSDPSLCCGYGSLSPSCLPANGTKKCCTHYLAATQCNPDQVCGGSGGPGASSYAQCGPANSTFCDKGDGQGAFCTAAAPTCCGYYGGFGFCCAAGCACNNSAYTCNCPVTAAPTTVAPTTVAPTTAAPTTTPAPPRNNCPGAGSSAGVNCSDPSLCCGYGSLFPSCLPANGTKKCCTHYLAATQCDPDQTCGGGGGPGASSYAQCGPANSTFCDKGDGQGAFCTTAMPTCCGYYGGYGFCCAAGCACNNSAYTCNCPVTAAPTTVAPTTVAPTTAAPTTTPAPPQNNCPGAGSSAGVNCSDPSLCCGYGSLFPSCLPANGTKKCCTHYLAATQCDPDQVCGGGGGPGASSYAQCGPAGSTYCDKGTGQGTFCTAAAPTCCGYYGGFGFCCAPGCACNNSAYTCSCPTTAAPTTVAPTTAAPTTTPAPPKNNCPGAGSSAGVNCSDPSLCCGYGSLSPTCLPANGTKKCCTHYLAATQCDPDQVCGGGLGPGASSYATCGPPGSTFCDKGTGTGAFCNATLPTCCGYSGGYGFCCAPGCACNNSAYTCSCPTPTTVAPTTAAPTTAPPPMPNCPGVNGYGGVNCSSASLCCGAGTITPSCLPADGSKKCCVHYLSSTQCNPNQVCGGSGGPGASSYAQCGPPGSTFCDKGDGQGAFCNATLPTCCGYYGGYGFCCAPGCACNNSAYTCNCPTPPPKPTDKPTPNRPTPPKPTPPSQKTCRTPGPRGKPATCGVNQQCCGAPNTNSFCCPANKRCNNARRTCF